MEDVQYSSLGLSGVKMALIYGDGRGHYIDSRKRLPSDEIDLRPFALCRATCLRETLLFPCLLGG